MADLRDAEIIIIGGGIVGCSVAYQLARMGKKDVLLIEKNGLTQGSTWHAAGLVGQLRSSRNLTRVLQKSVEIYGRLEAETGQVVDWKQVGSLRLACSDERMLELKRASSMAKSFGLELQMLSPKQAQDLFPIMSTEDVLGAAFIPTDGYVDPSSVTQAFAKGARDNGAEIVQGVKVLDIIVENRRVKELITDHGTVKCDVVVNAAGFWSRDLALKAGVKSPAVALEHQYIITDPIPGVPDNMPGMRDPDHLIYYKPEVRGIAIGGWEPNTVSFGENGIPEPFAQELLPENFDRFEQLAINAGKRTPIVNEVGIRQMINGPIPWSADEGFILGWAPEVDNFFSATGISIGIAAAGGVGQMVAEWIIEGEPSIDLWPFDIRRFNDHHNEKSFLYPRTIESYGKTYYVHFPGEEHESARNIRQSPIYDVLKEHGASYGSKAGWERPNFFIPKGEKLDETLTFRRPNWFGRVAEEHKAVRERVALIDQSSFSKFRISGAGALKALQGLAVSDMDKEPGKIIYTQFLNPRGGIEADLTITRSGEDDFYLVTGSAFGVHDRCWIEGHIPGDGSVVIEDLTEVNGVINLCGPDARNVLGKVTDDDVSNGALPFATFKHIKIAGHPVRAQRIGYVGELGWELHMEKPHMLPVYQALAAAGKDFGIANVGYRAIDTLRMEKGYLYWSTDITPDYNPYEAGLSFRVNMKKGDFIGRDALERIRNEGVTRKLQFFTLDGEAAIYGSEPIMRDGKVLEVTTSANFGHTIGKPMVFGYLPVGECEHNDFQIEAFGEVFQATRHDGPLYDPKMERLKA
ncbi:MAG: FAD-dependent oxidoreductase [Rhodospirillaceae bacterium]|nr:FAD-dependent oxidoreductase [Rhodospirillaceae bacterium]